MNVDCLATIGTSDRDICCDYMKASQTVLSHQAETLESESIETVVATGERGRGRAMPAVPCSPKHPGATGLLLQGLHFIRDLLKRGIQACRRQPGIRCGLL